MIRNYFRIGIRNLRKNKGFSIINVFGLSLALTTFLFIFLFVQDEVTYDRMHADVDQLYRINTNYSNAGRVFNSGSSSPAMISGFKESIPQIDEAVRIQQRSYLMRISTEISIQQVHIADASFFDVFDFPMHSGTALSGDPSEVVITKSFADRLFRNQDPIGRLLELKFDSDFEPVEIVGVMDDLPINSSIQFEILLPFSRYEKIEESRMSNYLDLMLSSVIRVQEGADVSEVEDAMQAHFDENIDEDDRGHFDIELEKFTDIHFSETNSGNGIADGRSPETSLVLSFIGLLILVIAAINYINLSLGMLLPRAAEIGMRKVLGARKKSIITQFMVETAVITLIALILSFLLSDILQPQFERLMSKQFPLWEAGWTTFLGAGITLFLLITLLAGLYPALVVARFSATGALKQKQRLTGHTLISKVLIILQFSVSMLFVCGAWIVNEQISFIQDFDMGYNDNHVLYLSLPTEKNDLLLDHLNLLASQHPEIYGISGQTGSGWRTNLLMDNHDIQVDHDKVDANFADFFEIEIVEGRFFSENNPADKNAVVVNESLVAALELQDPVGQMLPFDYFEDMPEARIIGVVRDYHHASLHQPILPQVLYTHSDRPLRMVYVKYSGGQIQEVVKQLENFWQQEAIEMPLSYGYLSELNTQEYESELQQQQIISFASLFAVIISCLGLFALSGLYISQQQRALGIRKVLGASLLSISGTVSKRFTILVLIACLITLPLGWMAAREWLQTFTYKINLSIWPFLLSMIVLLGIALISIIYQAYRAGSVNPVDVLRNE